LSTSYAAHIQKDVNIPGGERKISRLYNTANMPSLQCKPNKLLAVNFYAIGGNWMQTSAICLAAGFRPLSEPNWDKSDSTWSQFQVSLRH